MTKIQTAVFLKNFEHNQCRFQGHNYTKKEKFENKLYETLKLLL